MLLVVLMCNLANHTLQPEITELNNNIINFIGNNCILYKVKNMFILFT